MATSSLSHSSLDAFFSDASRALSHIFAAAPAGTRDPHDDASLAALPDHLLQDIGLDPHRIRGRGNAWPASVLGRVRA